MTEDQKGDEDEDEDEDGDGEKKDKELLLFLFFHPCLMSHCQWKRSLFLGEFFAEFVAMICCHILIRVDRGCAGAK